MRKSNATREPSANSSNHQAFDSPALLGRSISSTSSIAMRTSSDLHTNLSLGLSISTPTYNFSPRQEASADWSSSSSSLSSKQVMQMNDNSGDNSLFVKVNMEGGQIGRKIDLLALHCYPHLITTLEHMFNTPNILWAEGEQDSHHKRYNCSHVLTYEDQDGDWMMVGDVPWELFLTTVKRLKITSTSWS